MLLVYSKSLILLLEILPGTTWEVFRNVKHCKRKIGMQQKPHIQHVLRTRKPDDIALYTYIQCAYFCWIIMRLLCRWMI